MFFHDAKINDILNCPLCKCRYDVPLVLPCGETVCQNCVHASILSAHQLISSKQSFSFKCLLCKDKHDMNKNGLVRNKLICKMLDIEPDEVYRGETIEKFKKSLSQLMSKRFELFDYSSHKEDIIRNHYETMRQQVQMVTESRLNEISEASERLLSEIDAKEKENLDAAANYVLTSNSENNLNALVDQINRFSAEWSSYLNQAHINKSQIVEASRMSNELANVLDEQFDQLKCFIFQGKRMKFIENEEKLRKDHIGLFASEYLKSSKISIKYFKRVILDVKACEVKQIFGFVVLDNGNMALVFLKNSKGEDKLFFHVFGLNGSRIEGINSVQPFLVAKHQFYTSVISSSTTTTTSTMVQSPSTTTTWSSNNKMNSSLTFASFSDIKKSMMAVTTTTKTTPTTTWPTTTSDYSRILFSFYDDGRQYLDIGIVGNLVNKRRTQLKYTEFSPMGHDQTSIYVLDNSCSQIDVYAYGIDIDASKTKRCIKLNDLSSRPIDLALGDNLIYLICQNDDLILLNKTDGSLVTSTNIEALSTSHRYFTKRSLILVDERLKKLEFYDLESLALKTSKDLDGLDTHSILIAVNNDTDTLFFLDKTTSIVYIY